MRGPNPSQLVIRPVCLLFLGMGVATAGCTSDGRLEDRNRTTSGTSATDTVSTDLSRTDAYRNPLDTYHGFRASQLINKSVENPQGESLGEIEDLVVNLTNGEVRYAVLQFGGMLGMGDRLFAIPTKELRFAQDKKDDLVLNIDKSRLENAKHIETDRNSWPKDWNAWDDIATVSGTPVTPPSGETARAYRASDLIGKNVQNAQGTNIGEIKDLVIDLSSQKVHYTVLSFDPSFASADKLISFPVTAFKLDPTEDKLVLDMEKEKLKEMPGFSSTSWPDINDPGYVSDVKRDLDSYPNVESPTAMFTRLDTNKDGYLSMEEANVRSSVKNSWTRLDQDHDDRVSQTEFVQYY